VHQDQRGYNNDKGQGGPPGNRGGNMQAMSVFSEADELRRQLDVMNYNTRTIFNRQQQAMVTPLPVASAPYAPRSVAPSAPDPGSSASQVDYHRRGNDNGANGSGLRSFSIHRVFTLTLAQDVAPAPAPHMLDPFTMVCASSVPWVTGGEVPYDGTTDTPRPFKRPSCTVTDLSMPSTHTHAGPTATVMTLPVGLASGRQASGGGFPPPDVPSEEQLAADAAQPGLGEGAHAPSPYPPSPTLLAGLHAHEEGAVAPPSAGH
jgi:hypothetical protein